MEEIDTKKISAFITDDGELNIKVTVDTKTYKKCFSILANKPVVVDFLTEDEEDD